MAINQIQNLNYFYQIKNTDKEENLNENLFAIYNKYKNGIIFDEFFNLLTRLFGNIFHMSASVIIYSLSLNLKEKKYIIYFIICFVLHFIIDSTGQLIHLFNINILLNLMFPGLVVILFIISYFV